MNSHGYRNVHYNQSITPVPYNMGSAGYLFPSNYSNSWGYRQMYPPTEAGQYPIYPQTYQAAPAGQQYMPVHPPTQPPQQSLPHAAQSPQFLFTEPDVSVPLGGGISYHVHEFKGVTSTNDGHDHEFIGTTEPGSSTEPTHTHLYWAVTQYKDGHRHELKGRTGPAIPVQGGGHIHVLQGETFGYPDHQHHYRTGTEPSKE